MKKLLIQLSFLIFISLIYLTCKDDINSNINIAQNTQPIINESFATSDLLTYGSPISGEVLNLFCIAFDQQNDPLTITWTSEKGIFLSDNKGPFVQWLAPAVDSTENIDRGIGENSDIKSYNLSTENTSSINYLSTHAQVTVSDGKESVSQTIPIIVSSPESVKRKPCPDIPYLTYKGRIYNTVQIGEQCWMKENLDVGIMIKGSSQMSDNGIVEKYCYNNVPINCSIYGGFYQWDEAMQYLEEESGQGICPEGWHIPSISELATLSSNGGARLSLKGDTGFSALFAGYRFDTGFFVYKDSYTFFWSSTQTDSINAQYIYLKPDLQITQDAFKKNYGRSIRCIKD